MTISEQDFKDLKRGDQLVDMHDRTWQILGGGTHDTGSILCCTAKCLDFRADELRWINYLKPHGIYDNELRPVIELNHPNARVQKAS